MGAQTRRRNYSGQEVDFPASLLNWGLILYFSPEEHWGPLDKVSGLLVRELDTFRHHVGVPLILTPVGEGAAYASEGHAARSWHYCIPGRNEFARAVDVFPGRDFWRVALEALKWKWRGVGIYPFARYGEIRGMLHLDLRFGERVVWWRDEDMVYKYFKREDVLLEDILRSFHERLQG